MSQTRVHIDPLQSGSSTLEPGLCYHCGEPNSDSTIRKGDKVFCCNGCKLVYELLEDHDMCAYYDMEENPGNTPEEAGLELKYKYLDDPDIISRLIQFSDGIQSNLTLRIPSMHCASCVYLLETLYKLNPAITQSRVDYLKKELYLSFNEKDTSLRKLVELLSSIGYEPEINLHSVQQQALRQNNKTLYIRLGVAGFAFANIMLFAFPDYLALRDSVDPQIQTFFLFLTVLLSIPVLLYSAREYFESAWNGWKQRSINMDVPISLGIITLYTRSVYEIVLGHGTGYMDSFTGLVFLLLLGKLFERKTYDSLSFDRDYRSYFPVSVLRKRGGTEEVIPLEHIKPGDRILIRNQELIPADSVLLYTDSTHIDYSFVTGESTPVEKKAGDMIYAGGKHIGATVELDVIKDVDQSYLTELWNENSRRKGHDSRMISMADHISKYFTAAVILIALAASAFWLIQGSAAHALNAFTAVLIVACPCALALSTPFTLGSTLRIFGKNGFYLKNTSVIESLARIRHIVFDKTGTITRSRKSQIQFVAAAGIPGLARRDLQGVQALTRHSSHPLSRQIFESFQDKVLKPVSEYRELEGLGIQGNIEDREIKLGSAEFIGVPENLDHDILSTRTYLLAAGRYLGFFMVTNMFRDGLKSLVHTLSRNFSLSVITGDTEKSRDRIIDFFPKETEFRFRQSPFDKQDYVHSLQEKGEKVMMIGDGLNDAGALRQSNVGVSLSEDVNTFTPASDAILSAAHFTRLASFMQLSRRSMRIILISFLISFSYNFVGLGFAVTGTLSPLIAAILMPLSSITVVLFTTGSTRFAASRLGLNIFGEGDTA